MTPIEDVDGPDLGREQSSGITERSGASMYSSDSGVPAEHVSGDADVTGPAGTPESDPAGTAAEAAADDPMVVGTADPSAPHAASQMTDGQGDERDRDEPEMDPGESIAGSDADDGSSPSAGSRSSGDPDSDIALENDSHARTERALDDLQRRADDERHDRDRNAAADPPHTDGREASQDAEQLSADPVGAGGGIPGGSGRASDREVADADESASDAAAEATDDEAEKERTAAEFAAEHDPADHDVDAGDEFRQPGDWTADEAGGTQVWDADGNLVSDGGGGNADGADTGADDSGRAAESGETGSGETGSGDESSGDESSGGRRVSAVEEVVDGGYGWGSAATIDDGAMPMGHPVKAWEDTRTYVAEGHQGYDAAEPHVWFTDPQAAHEAGFSPVN